MDDALKIGILHYTCPPVVGGVEEIVNQHASILHRLNQQVTVLAGKGGTGNEPYEVKIEPLFGSKHQSVLKAHEQVRRGDHLGIEKLTSRILERLTKLCGGLDILMVHNVLQMPFNLPLTLAIRRLAESDDGVKVVSWAHDSPYFQPNPPDFLNSDPWTVLRMPHPLIHYVTISESRKELFLQQGERGDWTVINNGIDPMAFFYLDPRSVKLASELRLFDRDLVMVQPSRITPRKNLELSIHIVRGIKALGYNVLFVMTGAYDPHETRATSYYRRLRYWIQELDLKDHIAILAEYRFKDKSRLVPDRIFIRDLYLMADLLLMTSKDEGFGLPLLEAGMIKLPIACTAIPPFLEVGRDVCFFGKDDPPLFIAGRIVEYLSRSNTHRMYRHVMKNYVMERVCRDRLLPYLRTLLDIRKKRRNGPIPSGKSSKTTLWMGINPLFSRAFVARWWRGRWIQGARWKMDEGILSVRQSHFSSATQEPWGSPPPQ